MSPKCVRVIGHLRGVFKVSIFMLHPRIQIAKCGKGITIPIDTFHIDSKEVRQCPR